MAIVTTNLLGDQLGFRVFTVGDRVRLECKLCRKRIIADSLYIAQEFDANRLARYMATVVETHLGTCEKNPNLMIVKASIPPQAEPQKRPYSRRFEME